MENYALSEEMEKGAVISQCGHYRYTLTRQWEDGEHVAFLMFNPSTADAMQDDPTIRKCIGFAKRWGYGCLTVLNLFAFRSTDPRALARISDPVGLLNDYWIYRSLRGTREIVCAWGCGQHMKTTAMTMRPRTLLRNIREHEPYTPIVCLGRRLDSAPRHPLMLGYDTPRETYVLEGM